jgi:ketosteroid isomerase-like protein
VPPADPEKGKAELLARERGLSDAAAGTGIRALVEAMSADVRINFSGTQPVRGKEAGLAALSKKPGTYRWAPESAFVSNAGDLGYVIGILEYAAGAASGSVQQTNSYIHIWKKNASGRWEIVLQVTVPVPPAAPGA